MDFDAVMKQLQAAGSEQTRKTYARHGVSGEMYGVSYSEFGKLQKSIKKNHALARKLWDTGNHDARVLATMIADPELMDMALLESWLRQIDNPPLSDAFVSLVAKSPFIVPCMELWQHSEAEGVSKIYWNLVAQRAGAKNSLEDSWFEPLLNQIQTQIHAQPDRVRHAMNQALIAIGVRSAGLEIKARAVAQAIGKVQVDHGQTQCKTPDALRYMDKTLAKKGHVLG